MCSQSWVGAPAAVAALARVDVVVQQVGAIAAVLGGLDEVVGQALGDGAVRPDGGHVVAAVLVEVEERLPAEVVGRRVLRQSLGGDGSGLALDKGRGHINIIIDHT
ncbi:hypothetical protein VTK73DRAFT_4579 [Phialemonium thermophilum]|uniref:Uncharacterized protein n=1 Tax=Phialemonium thermophilum TaxID=223376 RepID=A0ABR3V7H3_9PEZI